MGRLLACEPEQRRITRTSDVDRRITVLTDLRTTVVTSIVRI